MASHHHQLVAKGKGKMSGTRGVQTGQTVNLKRNGQQRQRQQDDDRQQASQQDLCHSV
jgi:hypothetical protein